MNGKIHFPLFVPHLLPRRINIIQQYFSVCVTSVIADTARAVAVVVAVAAVSVPCLTVPVYHLIRAAHIF